MNKVLITVCLCFLGSVSFSQENIKLVYSSCTEKSLEELEKLTLNNKLKYKTAFIKYNDLKQNGKIILSSKEFAPIKKIINNYQNGIPLSQEEKIYAEEALNKYISITDIISK